MYAVRVPSLVLLLAAVSLALGGAAFRVSAQHPVRPGEVHGYVRDADTGDPLAGAVVMVVGSGLSVITHSDGRFHIRVSASGTQVLRVERLGYRSASRSVVPRQGSEPVVFELDPSVVDLPGLVVTGSLTERGAAEALHPVNVLAGDKLQRRLRETLAATVASEPGVTATSMGPATSHPVIRGLSGDRVLILEDGVRVGDVSNSGADHANATDGASARRVEVLRGPGALLYGSNALGGVVNVIRDEIPLDHVHHLHGAATLQGRTVNQGMQASVAGVMPLAEWVPLRFELSGRTAGDLATPVGDLTNTAMEAWAAGVGSSVVGDWGAAGAAFRYHGNDYGIPGGFVGGHAEGVRVEMERASTKGRVRLERPVGPFRSLDVDGAYTWYRHTELEAPDIIGTFFKRQAASAEAVARHARSGSITGGAVGVRASWERHDFAGSLSTSDTHTGALAAFVVEEMEFGPMRLEVGARYDWSRVDPIQKDPASDIGDIRTRTFHAASGSLGALFRLSEAVAVGGSVARAFRVPDVNELFSEGPHLAAYTFEVGNPGLGTEVGAGVDAFVRVGGTGFRGELAGFHNRLSGYIYPRETGDTSRVGLPVFQYAGDDAVLSGFEGHVEVDVLRGLMLEATASYVRGTLDGTEQPLPLIPPLQGRVALEYARPAWFIRGEAELAQRQDRLGEFETATDGYAIYHASAGVRRTVAGRLNSLTMTFENATNSIYRNHLSRVKEIMPEAGRGLTVTYRVLF